MAEEKKKTKEAGKPKPKKKKVPKEAQETKEKKGEAKAKEAKPKVKRPVEPRKKTDFELNYSNKCIPALIEKFGYKNKMRVPKLKKIVVNTCLKEALQDIKVLETAAEELANITGQRPVLTKAKKSIANFKLRTGVTIGARVTLRGANMYEFMNRLVSLALPRVRDFKGVSAKSFDGQGNYTLGLTEQIIFPEINFDKIQRVTGMNVTFVTTAETNEEGKELLKLMGVPFRSQ